MAFRTAQSSRVYVWGKALHAHADSVDVSHGIDMLDVTTLADTSRAFIPGADTSTLTMSGPLDGTPSNNIGPLANLKTAAVNTPITYLPLGTDSADAGSAWLIAARETELEATGSHSGRIEWSMQAQVTSITDINGVVLENNLTVTTDTDGTAVDNGAATTNGAVFHLHVTAFSGFTSDAITVEGSATGAFAGEETTVATFATITSAVYALAPAERITVTGSVPRYLRVADDVTGTGSITRFVAVSRR